MRALLYDGRKAQPVTVPAWVRLRAEPHGDEIGCECVRCGSTELVSAAPRHEAETALGRFALRHSDCRERVVVPPRRLGPVGLEFVTYVTRGRP